MRRWGCRVGPRSASGFCSSRIGWLARGVEDGVPHEISPAPRPQPRLVGYHRRQVKAHQRPAFAEAADDDRSAGGGAHNHARAVDHSVRCSAQAGLAVDAEEGRGAVPICLLVVQKGAVGLENLKWA